MTEDQFQLLLSIVDRHAGRKHSADGSVAQALREVLAEHERMIVSRFEAAWADILAGE